MRVQINDTEVIIPSSLSEITLGQRIDFYELHGRDLDAMAKSIMELSDEVERELELSQFQIEKMFRTFSFFSGVDIDTLKQSEFVDELAAIYFSTLSVLLEDEKNLKPQRSFTWQGEQWVIMPPELKQGSKITFGEFIDSKQIIQDLYALGKGDIEKLLPLCAIYLRHEGEAYSADFVYDDSGRMALMRQLPMDIALQVGFFLSSSISLCVTTSPFSGPAASKVKVETAPSISSSGGG